MPEFWVSVYRTIISSEDQRATIIVEAENQEAARVIAMERLEKDDEDEEFDWDTSDYEEETDSLEVGDVEPCEEEEFD